MAISANSIIHYTDRFETLIKIIQDSAFRYKYCKESINTRGNRKFSFAILMVSFCDIPLSDYKKHFKKKNDNNLGYYGDYGIGLNKTWAKKKGLNPVLYIEAKSHIGMAVRKSAELLLKSIKHNQKTDITQFPFYIKNYQGELVRDEKHVKDYRFYDEREWRYVPQQNELSDCKIVLNIEKYLEDKDNLNLSVKKFKLNFSLSDISYIIIKDNSELKELIEVLKSKYFQTNIDEVLTKIITSKQIMSDF